MLDCRRKAPLSRAGTLLTRVGRAFRSIDAFEWFGLVNLVAALAYLSWAGVAAGWSTVAAALRGTMPTITLSLLGGMALRALVLAASGQRQRLRHLLSTSSLVLLGRITVVTAVTSYAYIWLKLTVPLTRAGVLYDTALWNVDRCVHLGVDPVLTLPDILTAYGVLPWFDRYYTLFIPTILVAIGWFATTDDLKRRSRFALGYTMLWSVGAWLYVAVPALGPCYVAQKLLLPFYPQLPLNIGAQQALWQNYQHVLAARVSGVIEAPFTPTYGIACMPSLHVGAQAFFAFWAWRRNRFLLWFYLVLTELTLVGSVATGWHYAVDGYAGLILAILCAAVARFRDRPLAGQEAQPASARE